MEVVAASLTGGDAGEERRRAAAGRGERRRPDAVREEVGLGAESSEGREEKLPPRGIGAALTGGGESAAARSSGGSVHGG